MLRALVLIAAAVFFREMLSGNSRSSTRSRSPYWDSFENAGAFGVTKPELDEASVQVARLVSHD